MEHWRAMINTRVIVRIAKQIAELVDFDYVIKPVKDGKYGGLDENNTWDGMVGELVRNVSAPHTAMHTLC